jgi:hypothetical protein
VRAALGGFACGPAAASSANAAGAPMMITAAMPKKCRRPRGANDDAIKAGDAA